MKGEPPFDRRGFNDALEKNEVSADSGRFHS